MPADSDQGPEQTGPRYLLLGQILRPHGVRGEMRMRILTDYPERITELAQVFVGENADDTGAIAYHVEHMRMHQDYGLLKLKGINDRDEAELLRTRLVMVTIEDAVPLEEGEFYLYQLIGIEVRLADNGVLGTVVDLIETGANDVYVIDSPQFGEVLIPVTDETIIETNVVDGYIIVQPPAGLLPPA